MFLSEVHALFFGFTPVQTWTSQVWHCKDPISKILRCSFFFLDPGQTSWIRIQTPRFNMFLKKLWIQGRNLGSNWDWWIQGFSAQVFQHLGSWIRIQDFYPGSKKSFLNILDSCALGSEVWQLFRLEIPSLTAVQTWNPMSEIPPAMFKSNVIYVNVYVSVYV